MIERIGLRVEVRLTDLARPPSPEEVQAMALAVEKALAASAPAEAAVVPSAWRFQDAGGVNTPGGHQAALSGSQNHSNRPKSQVFPRCG